MPAPDPWPPLTDSTLMEDARADYRRVLANLGATDSEINDLLAEDDEDTIDIARELEDRGVDAPRPAGQEWEPADLGERTCDVCGTVTLELPCCEACGAQDERFPF